MAISILFFFIFGDDISGELFPRKAHSFRFETILVSTVESLIAVILCQDEIPGEMMNRAAEIENGMR